jgi:hypothetical protein
MKLNITEKEFAEYIVNFMNELLEYDKNAIACLIANRVPCNEKLSDHPTVQVMRQNDGYTVGLLGILNGLIGCDNNFQGYIGFEFQPDEESSFRTSLSRFIVMEPKNET